MNNRLNMLNEIHPTSQAEVLTPKSLSPEVYFLILSM